MAAPSLEPVAWNLKSVNMERRAGRWSLRLSTGMQEKIPVQVNGEAREIAAGLSILQYLEQLQIHPGRVAIEYNEVILRRGEWPKTIISPNSQIEIVHFVGGG